MSKPNLITLIILGLVLVGGAIIVGRRPRQTPPVPATQANSPFPSPANENAAEPVVGYTNSGFTPLALNVKIGTTVKFVNRSSGLLWVASSPHPAHTDYPDFDQKRGVGPEEGYAFVFTEAGNYQYHNHLNPQDSGSITVE